MVYRIQILCIRYSDNLISVFIFFLSPKVNVALYSHFTHSIKFYYIYNIIWKAAFVRQWSYGYVWPIYKQNVKSLSSSTRHTDSITLLINLNSTPSSRTWNIATEFKFKQLNILITLGRMWKLLIMVAIAMSWFSRYNKELKRMTMNLLGNCHFITLCQRCFSNSISTQLLVKEEQFI